MNNSWFIQQNAKKSTHTHTHDTTIIRKHMKCRYSRARRHKNLITFWDNWQRKRVWKLGHAWDEGNRRMQQAHNHAYASKKWQFHTILLSEEPKYILQTFYMLRKKCSCASLTTNCAYNAEPIPYPSFSKVVFRHENSKSKDTPPIMHSRKDIWQCSHTHMQSSWAKQHRPEEKSAKTFDGETSS